MATKVQLAEMYRASNIEAAEIIVADLVRYPGVMQEGARLVLHSAPKQTAPANSEAA